jgi:hypothetical protein
MRPLPRLVRLSQCNWVVIALVLSVAADGNAQSHKWLLGNWSGTFGDAATPGTSSGSGTLTVREEAGALIWTWTGVVSGAGKTEAEGVVTKVDASSAELQGKLTSHYVPTFIGVSVKVNLRTSPSGLSGTGWNEQINSTTAWQFTKKK